ncbi:MAG: NAD(P)H-dependent oxidoreductase [Litorivicinus sp.]
MNLLVLFHSSTGHVKTLANAIARGCESQGVEPLLRNPPALDGRDTSQLAVTKDELRNCSGLALGSPTRFGQMATPLKAFFETTSDLWISGDMIDKPAAVFGASSSLHGGNEALLLGMALPLLHHGMLVTGVPYTDPGLAQDRGGVTPYGPSLVENGTGHPHPHEIESAQALGRRLATLIKALA